MSWEGWVKPTMACKANAEAMLLVPSGDQMAPCYTNLHAQCSMDQIIKLHKTFQANALEESAEASFEYDGEKYFKIRAFEVGGVCYVIYKKATKNIVLGFKPSATYKSLVLMMFLDESNGSETLCGLEEKILGQMNF